MPKPYVSIVIPIYNEQDNLAALFTRLTATMDMTGKTWEVLCTNDGSRDRSGEMLKEFHKQRPRQVRVIDFNGNFGQHMAIMAAFDVCDCPSIDHWLTDPYTPALVDDPQSEIHYREKTKKIALDVLNFISLFVSEHGYMPSPRDIAAKFSTSTSVINRYLDVLAGFNMIELTDGIARGIKILIQRKS